VSAEALEREPVDAAARHHIGSALAETLFVEAGAGTGKTTQLVQRVINLVVEGGVPLASIAAITFTEAAASELRDRIRETLERTAADATSTQECRDRCATALDEIDMAAISTLHAFAHRILSEHPVAAGLPPRVEVLDEVRSQLAFEKRWDGFVDELMTDPRYEAAVIRATRLGVRIEASASNQASLKDVARILGQNWDRLDTLLAGEPEGPPPPVDRRPLRESVESLLALDPQCRDAAGCQQQQHLRRLAPILALLLGAPDDEVLPYVADTSMRWTTRYGNKKHCEDPGAVRDALAEIGAAVEAERDRLIDDTMRRFAAELARFTEAHARQRALDGTLEFHDLLVLARHLLRSDAEARAALGDRYRRLLLDEFQDTDPIQIELAALVASSVDDGTDWRQIDPEPGRLFFVGDAKQSIYRFRRADVRVFMAARERFADGQPVELTENFRTVPPIIDWINRLFGEVMQEDPGRQPGYRPLSAHRLDDSGTDHRPVLMGGPHPDLQAAEIRELEATDVAGALRDIQDHPDSWPVFDRSLGDWRPARMDDVAILIPARTSLRILERALRDRDVRYRVDTGALVYDTQEVVELLAVLRVIDNPADAIALVAALRSPLFGCGDDDLAGYRQAGGSWDLTVLMPEELVDHPVGRSVTWLAELHSQRWWPHCAHRCSGAATTTWPATGRQVDPGI
jgi:ATP-dependent helicase/nuclease subunit A